MFHSHMKLTARYSFYQKFYSLVQNYPSVKTVESVANAYQEKIKQNDDKPIQS